MNIKRSLLAILFSPFMVMAQKGEKVLPQLGKSKIKDVIAAMTLEEKVKLVVGKGLSIPGISLGGNTDQTPDKVKGISGHTVAIPRLGIPSLQYSDGPAGIHIFFDSTNKSFTTAWPVGTLLASSWDTALAKKVGIAFGNEIREYGIDFILGPGMNIHRNPLGGRNFEYYSEDPLISGKTAAALINGIQSQHVGATIKHFVANNQETDRNSVNTIVSERALREIYLRGFEIAVKEAQPWAIMSSYNYVNGIYTSESYDLLTTILRNEWGFKGYVMTDWFGGKDAVAQIKAGNNLLMPGTKKQIKALMDAVKNKQLSETVLDKNVEGILNVMLQTPTFKNVSYSNHPDLKLHAQISREAAAESMVLLKNDNNTLPLANKSKSIVVFGNHAYDLIAGGTGSGDVSKAYTISLSEGLNNAGYNTDKAVQDAYLSYLKDYAAKHPKKNALMEIMNPTPYASEYNFDKNVIDQKATSTDIAIAYIGRNAGEGNDRKIDDDFKLSNAENELIDNVARAFHAQHKPVIVVLNIGGVIDVTSFRDKVDAILLAWQPGQEGGNAMADILSGKVNPSGKLATTFPASYSDVSSAKNFPGKEFPEKATPGMFGQKSIPAEVTYEEGIYVGYRYNNTFNVIPAYEFGYGLSYTNFKYENLKLSSTSLNDKISISLTVKNTGKVAGKEVVQLYVKAPAKKLDKPSEELKGFAKTKLLKPGESQIISFVIKAADIASFDTESSSWIAESGSYVVEMGASSRNFKLKSSFNLSKNITTEKVHKVLVPTQNIQELRKGNSASTSIIYELNNFRIGS